MTKQQIGAELKRLRTEAGLSQTALAEKIGESFQHISHIEAGKYNLTLDRLERVGAALGVTVTLTPTLSTNDTSEKSMLSTEPNEKACLSVMEEVFSRTDWSDDSEYDMRSEENRIAEEAEDWDI